MAIALTRELAAFVAGLRYEDIPHEALPVIHTGYADCVGVLLAAGVGALPLPLPAATAGVASDATATTAATTIGNFLMMPPC